MAAEFVAPERVRRDSLSAALELVHIGGTVRRAELTAKLGLSRSGTGALVEELERRGLVVVETHPDTVGEMGRPSHLVSLHPHGPVAAAVQLRSDRYRVGLVGLGGELVTETVHPVPQPSTPERVLGVIADSIVEVAASAGPRPCVGAGVAVPSAVSRRDEHALAALHLHWPPAVPVRQELADLLERRGSGLAVRIGNDANLAALAEYRHGDGQAASTLLFVTTGQQGVGGALVVDGRVYTGSAGYALEVGHVTVDPSGRPCHCGNRGCLDVEADPQALVDAAGDRVRKTEDAEAAARRILARSSDDPDALAAVGCVSDRLGVGLAGLVNLFNPDRIVLGGLHAELHRRLPDRLEETLRRRSLLSAASEVPLGPSSLGDDAILLGAGELALQPILDNPRRYPEVG